jgi:transposase-like protein
VVKLGKKGFNIAGTQRYLCSNCKRTFNERYGTIFWSKRHEDKVIILSCLLYSFFPLSYEQVSFILKLFGIDVSYFAIYYWINQLGKEIEKIKKHYNIRFKKVWHADKKYVKHRKKMGLPA